jgi:hypothetical protein
MNRKRRQNPRTPQPAGPLTLAGVLAALERQGNLSTTRQRDLVSGVKRVAILLEQEPAAVPLDLAAISARLAAVNPVAVGITNKRFTNIRSDFLAAIKASGLLPIKHKAGGKPALIPGWIDLYARLSGRRAYIGPCKCTRHRAQGHQ